MRISDDIILNLLKEGNKSAYVYLFNKYYTPLLLQACYILKDQMDAEDQVQDLFIEIMDKHLTDNIKSSLLPYLKTCLYHKCIAVINKNKNTQLRNAQYKLSYDAYITQNPFDRQDTQRSIDRLLGGLSGQRIKVCKLIYWENRKYKDVANEMGLTVNSVKTHIRLANRTLKEQCANSRTNMLNVLYA
jgi:RNA polymerase sigma factor (sigma-70 family)